MEQVTIQERTYEFALRIIKLFKYLDKNDLNKTIGKQLLRSGTSIGANVEEAYSAQSRKDFIHKLSIALKEARETHYWLRLMSDSDLVTSEKLEDITKESNSIKNIIGKTIVTTKANKSKG